MGILFLLFPAAEIYLLYLAVANFGFMQVIFFFLVKGFAALTILRVQGLNAWQQAQANLNNGKIPPKVLPRNLLVLLGGILLILPALICNAVGLLLILPGTSHVLGFVLSRFVQSQVKSGRIRVFSEGSFGGFSYSGSTSGFTHDSTNVSNWRSVGGSTNPESLRDVTATQNRAAEIIDIQALPPSSTEKT